MTTHAFIVEGNELLVKMYRSVFRALNCDVAHARTGADALRRLDGEQPDLIIVDECLADISGIETMRAIRALGQLVDTPLIATIPARSTLGKDELRALDVAVVVTKPLHLGSFSALVQGCLKARAKSTS